ncbi:MAG: DEAD/DEAH box helicase family protein, partial [Emcibacteraceae bacterium]|nr:DEAD/DEAH box helicase family protein [Emcibacteraceae bacterium]
HFLINAAPGAGKTIASCVIASELIDKKEIDRVIVIAPRSEVVNQWSDDFRMVTGRHMAKVTAADGDIASMSLDVCATWSAIQGLLPEFQGVCRSSNTLVICDEHHHAAVEAAWGSGANGAFEDSKYVVVLTGTPVRSDGAQSVWMDYDYSGAINHPEAGTYVLSYGDAVDLGYCRPVTFHRHEGKFTVELDNHQQISVSGRSTSTVPKKLKRIPGLQTAINFYNLARTPQYKKDGKTPLLTGYQATMIQSGCEKLDDLRNRMPNAGGLVIAPNIEMAQYMADLIEKIEGEKPILVHSQMPNPNAKIRAFRNTDKKWLVSVAMVSEGVDIKRLRVLLYLPNAMTELAFRQAIGRVVRTTGPDDDTRAYVVLPAFETFEVFAKRIEDEMSPSARKDPGKAKTKKCHCCEHECLLSASICTECGYEFPKAPERVRTCDDCGSINPATADTCHACGSSFKNGFTITLDEALRDGAIVRGIDITEAEVQESEKIAKTFRSKVLISGDEKLVHIIQRLPDESWARLKNILTD